MGWGFKEIVTHPRTAVTVLAVGAWCVWLGWVSLAVTVLVLGVVLASWRYFHLVSFDQWAGRALRSRWSRWALYMPKLPEWRTPAV